MRKDQDYLAELWLKESDFWHSNKDRVLLKIIRGYEILDMGCGAGTLSVALAKQNKNVTGIDSSPEYLKLAREKSKGLQVRFICADVAACRVKKQYDAVILSGVLEHIRDDAALLGKVHKLLKKGGELVILTSAYSKLYSAFDASTGHCRRYDRQPLVSLLEQNGFRIKKVRYWDALGLLILLLARLLGSVPVSAKTLGNPALDAMLNSWFEIFENKMLLPFGADLIIAAEK